MLCTRLLAWSLLGTLFLTCIGSAQDAVVSAVYTDNANGYFMFVPPKGWTAKHYTDDRSKVAFNHPTTRGLFIRLLVSEAPGETFDALMSRDQQTARQMRARGISCEINESTLCGFRCLEIIALFPNDAGVMKLWKFLSQGLHFNLQYAAPSREVFNEHLDEAIRSLETITVLNVMKTDVQKARGQQIANRLRLAELTAQWVNVDEARQLLEEARREFPESKRIKQALAELEARGAPDPSVRSWIAFRSQRDGNAEIYVMNGDGTAPTRLTTNSAADDHPRFSADGKRIVFRSERDGNQEIYIMNADGSRQTRLTNHPAKDSEPSFSPDGKTIVFTSKRDGDWRVYAMNDDGTNQRRLSSINGSAPRYSPDGMLIVFTSSRDGNPEVYLMAADGAEVRRLTTNNVTDSGPSFSQDGGHVLFASLRNGNFDVYEIAVTHGDERRWTNHPAHDGAPCYRPDGGGIVFMTNRDGDLAIYTIKANGSEPQRLSPPGSKDALPHVAGAP